MAASFSSSVLVFALLLLRLSAAFAQPASGPAQALVAGNQAMRAGDFKAAIEDFSVVTRANPQFAEGFFNLGLALEQDGDHQKAIAALEKARRLKTGLRGVNLFLGIAQYHLNELPAAEASMRRETQLDPNDASALMWLGVIELGLDHPERAIGPLDQAATLDPKNIDILYHRGRAHLLVSKSSYQAMYDLAPHSWRVHEVLAQADTEANRTDDAIFEYTQAIELAPTQPGLNEGLGDNYWIAGKLDLADKAYQRELALDPNDPVADYKLGALRVIVGTPQAGLPLLQQAIADDPTLENAYYYRGRALSETGDVEDGIHDLKRAAVAPKDESLNILAWYRLSQLYREQKRTAEAAEAMAEFRKLKNIKDQRQQAKLVDQVKRHEQLPKQEELPADVQ